MFFDGRNERGRGGMGGFCVGAMRSCRRMIEECGDA
jgi:hypothetical protein